MTTATITHEGETIHVPIKNISLPTGHRLIAPNEVPEGFFTQDDLDKKVKDRLKRKEKEYEGHVELEEGAVVVSAEDAEKLKERGLLSSEDDEGTVNVEIFDSTKAKAEKADDLERKENLRSAGDAAGITNFDAFEGLVNGETFDVEEGDEDEDPTVTVIHEEDGDEKRTAFKEYERFKPYHAALFGEEKTGKSGSGAPPMTPVTNKNGRKSNNEDPVDAFVEKANQRRSGKSSDEED